MATLGGLLLSGCVAQPPAIVWPQVPYETRMQQLQAHTAWSIQGHLQLSNANQHQACGLHWHHIDKQHDTLRFIAPLGLRSARLTISPSGAVLTIAGEPSRHAYSAQALLAEYFGHTWPVDHLVYWVRGMPAPHLPADITQNTYHHITHLGQDGWSITYSHYQWVDGLALPGHIEVSDGDMDLRLVVHRWTHH